MHNKRNSLCSPISDWVEVLFLMHPNAECNDNGSVKRPWSNLTRGSVYHLIVVAGSLEQSWKVWRGPLCAVVAPGIDASTSFARFSKCLFACPLDPHVLLFGILFVSFSIQCLNLLMPQCHWAMLWWLRQFHSASCFFCPSWASWMRWATSRCSPVA